MAEQEQQEFTASWEETPEYGNNEPPVPAEETPQIEAQVEETVAEEVEDNIEMRDDVNEGVIDEPDDEEEDIKFLQPDEVARIKEYEEELLSKIPLPGAPKEEAERRKKWLKILQKARLAIRKMHKE